MATQDHPYSPWSAPFRRVLSKKHGELQRAIQKLQTIREDPNITDSPALRTSLANWAYDRTVLETKWTKYRDKAKEWVDEVEKIEDGEEQERLTREVELYFTDTDEVQKSPAELEVLVTSILEDAVLNEKRLQALIEASIEERESNRQSETSRHSRASSQPTPQPRGDISPSQPGTPSPVPPERSTIVQTQPPNNSVHINPIYELKLEPLTVPTFSGEYWEWPSFWQLYSHLVHSQPIADIIKLSILRQHLQGSALLTISSLRFEAESYPIAVAELQSQYGNASRRVEDVYKRIEGLQYQKSFKQQEDTLKIIKGFVLQLEAYGSTSYDNPLLQNNIMSKFHISIQREVETRRLKKSYEMSIKEMLAEVDVALRREIALEERFPKGRNTVPVNSVQPDNPPSEKKSKHKKRNNEKEERTNIVQQEKKLTSTEEEKKKNKPSTEREDPNCRTIPCCPLCTKAHSRPEYCRLVRTIEERKQIVKEKNLCFRCLAFGHGARQCTMVCSWCGGLHHAALCNSSHQARGGPTMQTAAPKPAFVAGSNDSRNQNQMRSWTATNVSSPVETVPVQCNVDNRQDVESGRTVSETVPDVQSQHLPLTTQGQAVPQQAAAHDECQPAAREDKEIHGMATELYQFSGRMLVKEVEVSHNGKVKRTEVFLDTGSAISMVSAKLVQQLNLKAKGHKRMKLTGVHGLSEGLKRYPVVDISLRRENGEIFVLEAISVEGPMVGAIPSTAIPTMDQLFLNEKHVHILDPNRTLPYHPEVVVGNNHIYHVLDSSKPNYNTPSGMTAISTIFGYVMGGQSQQSMLTVPICSSVDVKEENGQQENKSFEQAVTKFLQLDTLPAEDTGPDKEAKAAELEEVERHFKKNIEYKNGTYFVSFYFKDNIKDLSPNYNVAYKRLKILLKTLQKDKKLLSAYDDMFNKQLEAGYIEEVKPGQEPDGPVFLLPHQGVLRPGHTSHPLRIVFDASSHARGQISLNDTIHPGDTQVEQIPSLLMRLRLTKYIQVSDVEKAFLRVKLHESSRDVTRFLWIQDLDKPPDITNLRLFRYTSVPFGIDQSPFLLKSTITHALTKKQEELNKLDSAVDNDLRKRVIGQILNNIYVDNVAVGYRDRDDGYRIYEVTKEVFSEMDMKIREFSGPDLELMQMIPEMDRGKSGEQKILGVSYNNETDKIILQCTLPEIESTLTKRRVLSIAASTYDPMGLMVPLLLPLKLKMQALWAKDYKWDSPLDEEDTDEWMKVMENAHSFHYEMNRYMGSDTDEPQYLVAFTDASKEAAGAIVFLKNSTGIFPLFARSQLAPRRKPITIPKFELKAIEMGMSLLKYCRDSLRKGREELKLHYRLYSDSAVALQWTQKIHPSRNKYAINRVNSITAIKDELTEFWSPTDDAEVAYHPTFKMAHVRSKDNPADHASRGLTATELNDKQHIWWNGPSWMQKAPEEWPSDLPEEPIIREEQEEECPVLATQTDTASYKPILDPEKFSDLKSMVKRMAYVLRVLAKVVPPEMKERHSTFFPKNSIPSLPNAQERAAALRLLIRDHQQAYLHNIKDARNLKPVLFDDGLYHCTAGRMAHSSLSPESRHPIILIGKDARLTQLIVKHEHLKKGHAGPAFTLCSLQEKYWITDSKRTVQKVWKSCLMCKKEHTRPCTHPNDPPFPPERVQVSVRPFQNTGLDFLGPITTKADKNDVKTYVLLLTCLSTRAVHLEVVTELSTKRFLNALTRFVSRRGVPDTILSDNAESFHLAKSILDEMFVKWQKDDDVLGYMAEQGIDWRFTAPYAPWRGAVYERLVGSTKLAFRKTIGRKKLDHDDFETIMHGIEAIINTRPLTHVSDNFIDSMELPVIRPIDFLIPRVKLSFPSNRERQDEDDAEYIPHDIVTKTRMSTVNQYEKTLCALDTFWEIWRTAYLQQLKQVGSRNQAGKNPLQGGNVPLRVGDVVTIVDSDSPRGTWKMARVIELRKSTLDDEIRTAVIRRPNGKIKERPINLLVPLEVMDSQEQPETTEEEEEIPVMPVMFGEQVDECLLCDGYHHTPEQCTTVTDVHIRAYVVFKQDRCVRCLESLQGHERCNRVCSHCGEPHHESLCKELAMMLQVTPAVAVVPKPHGETNTEEPPKFIRLPVLKHPKDKRIMDVDRPMVFVAKLLNEASKTTIDVEVIVGHHHDNVINMELAQEAHCKPMPDAVIPGSSENPRVLIHIVGTEGELIPLEAAVAPGFQKNVKVAAVPNIMREDATSLGYPVMEPQKTEFRAKILVTEGWLTEIWRGTVMKDLQFTTTSKFPVVMANDWMLLGTRLGGIIYSESYRNLKQWTMRWKVEGDDDTIQPIRHPTIPCELQKGNGLTQIAFKTLPEYADLRMIIASQRFAQSNISSKPRSNYVEWFVIVTPAGQQIPVKIFITSDDFLFKVQDTGVTHADADFLNKEEIIIDDGSGEVEVEMAIPKCLWKLFVRDTSLRMPSGTQVWNTVFGYFVVSPENSENFQQHAESPQSVHADTAEKKQHETTAERTQNHEDAKNTRKDESTKTTRTYTKRGRSWRMSKFALTACVMLSMLATTQALTTVCHPGGISVYTEQDGTSMMEVCADSHCEIRTIEQEINEYRFEFPAHVTIHDHDVHVKYRDEDSNLQIINTKCESTEFCASIDCTWCWDHMHNPHCYPTTTLFILATLWFTLLLLCLFSVTIVVRCCCPRHYQYCCNKFKCCSRGETESKKLSETEHNENYELDIVSATRTAEVGVNTEPMQGNQTVRERSSNRLGKYLQATIMISLIGLSVACPATIEMHSESEVCEGNTCTVKENVMLKVNPIFQESCISLKRNGKVIGDFTLKLKNINLDCRKSTSSYHRNVQWQTAYSKRCHSAGSCTGSKCEDVNTTSYVHELHDSFKHPGNLYCRESCGGFGCGCFFPQSACLFYRNYVVPKNEEIYSIFSCTSWQESADIEVRWTVGNKTHTQCATLLPNTPVTVGEQSVILSSLSIPPVSILSESFIERGNEMAIWRSREQPIAHCENAIKAQELGCTFIEECKCAPAENKVVCYCKQKDLEDAFSLQQTFPIRTPYAVLTKYDTHPRMTIERSISMELIVTLKANVTINNVRQDESTCRLRVTELKGCFDCVRGAHTDITCFGNQDEIAIVKCKTTSFSLHCSPQGTTTTKAFDFDRAAINEVCNTSCTTQIAFHGILHFAGGPRKPITLTRVAGIQAGPQGSIDFALPDISHLMNIVSEKIKTTIFIGTMAAILALATWLTAPRIISKCVTSCWKGCRRIRKAKPKKDDDGKDDDVKDDNGKGKDDRRIAIPLDA